MGGTHPYYPSPIAYLFNRGYGLAGVATSTPSATSLYAGCSRSLSAHFISFLLIQNVAGMDLLHLQAAPYTPTHTWHNATREIPL